MLQVRENEISLRKWSGGAAQLRTLERASVMTHTSIHAKGIRQNIVSISCVRCSLLLFCGWSNIYSDSNDQ